MRPGHLIFCYQTDRRELMGICRLVKFVNVRIGDVGAFLTFSDLQNFVPVLRLLLPATRRPIDGLLSQAQLMSEATTASTKMFRLEVSHLFPDTRNLLSHFLHSYSGRNWT
jgi:hypothetical protein